VGSGVGVIDKKSSEKFGHQNCVETSPAQLDNSAMSLEERLSKIRDSPKLQGQQQVLYTQCAPQN
jgi:hypothetical protein